MQHIPPDSPTLEGQGLSGPGRFRRRSILVCTFSLQRHFWRYCLGLTDRNKNHSASVTHSHVLCSRLYVFWCVFLLVQCPLLLTLKTLKRCLVFIFLASAAMSTSGGAGVVFMALLHSRQQHMIWSYLITIAKHAIIVYWLRHEQMQKKSVSFCVSRNLPDLVLHVSSSHLGWEPLDLPGGGHYYVRHGPPWVRNKEILVKKRGRSHVSTHSWLPYCITPVGCKNRLVRGLWKLLETTLNQITINH